MILSPVVVSAGSTRQTKRLDLASAGLDLLTSRVHAGTSEEDASQTLLELPAQAGEDSRKRKAQGEACFSPPAAAAPEGKRRSPDPPGGLLGTLAVPQQPAAGVCLAT